MFFGIFAFSSNASAQLLNEILVNPNGTDSNCEYVEIIGSPGAALTNVYFASVEGDDTSNPGAFDVVVDLSARTLGSNGLLVIASDAAGDCTRTYNSPTTTLVQVAGFSFENGGNSWLLIRSTTPIVEGTDYDADNNGTLERLPAAATIIDGFGWSDPSGTDVTYGARLDSSGFGTAPDAATRFPGNKNPLSIGAWYYGDMDGENTSLTYDKDEVSANFPSDGVLTPGAVNIGTPATGRQRPSNDFDGDGRTDFAVVRDQTGAGLFGGGASLLRTQSARERLKLLAERNKSNENNLIPENHGTSLVWYISNSDNGAVRITGHGTAATDLVVPEDYDGDGKDDLATWRGIDSTTAFFYILESSTNTVREVNFGVMGDDPTVSGDYDGDGKADPAVYRCPGSGSGQCTFYYLGSNNNPNRNITFIPFGAGNIQTIVANPGDYDGDGKYDFCVFREAPGTQGQGQFVVLNSSDGSVKFANWGLINDLVAPGDYDGDGRSDFMVRRVPSNPYEWYLLESDGGGTGANFIQWGFNNDLMTPGDYDGDGKQDIAIWRPDTNNPFNNFFYVRRSSNLTLLNFEWGDGFDYPTANWYIH